MKTFFSKGLVSIAASLLLMASVLTTAYAEDTYTATTMRLLHYEGSVEITDGSGKAGVLLENARLNSGTTMKTGADSSASIGMDASKVVTLDENTTVEFIKQSKNMKVTLSEGALLLDVKEKLKDEETLDLKTSNMSVGIRGTVIYLRAYTPTEETDPDLINKLGNLPNEGTDCRVTVLGVLEGSTEVTYKDSNGRNQAAALEAGKKIAFVDTDNDGKLDLAPESAAITKNDLEGFVNDRCNMDAELREHIENGSSDAEFHLKENQIYNTTITVTAQSASKMFDGSELTYTTDVMVDGVPSGYTYRAVATGSQTNAGQGENPVDFHIYDTANGNADVTDKFTNITIIPGVLTVDPAPLHAWSGSAEKVYDGTPLTCDETELTFSIGYEKRTVSTLNLSYVVTEQPSSSSGTQVIQNTENTEDNNVHNIQTLYGISGTVLVHGSNPITGEIEEFSLKVGERLTVYLYEEADKADSIKYKVETIKENDIPDEILCLYRDNPDLLKSICTDAGWDLKVLQKRIEGLSSESTASQVQDGITYSEGTTDPDNMMQDSTNVRINIDTDLGDYKNRALDSEEAHFTPMKVDPQIKIVTNASITNVGSIPNTFTIDWGNALKSNYILTTEFGTLTVTEAPLTVTTGSAEKTYDGEPLTNSEARISGLVNGETATVYATGAITNPGTTPNTYTIAWGTADRNNYSVSARLGSLKVTAGNTAAIVFTAPSASKTYDGTALTAGSVTATGIPATCTFEASTSGSQTDAGSSTNTVSSYRILDANGNDVTSSFTNISTENGTLTVNKASATVTTRSGSKAYDGTALTNSAASITGLVSGDTATVTATGSVTNVGSADNTYSIDWGETNKNNYTLTENLGTLEVTKNNTAIVFTAPDASKTYDGTALTADDVTATGIPATCTFEAVASGSQTDAGSSVSTVSSYSILDADGNDVTSNFTNISTENGTLTVNKADVTITSDTLEKAYDGTALVGTVTITGLAEADKDKVTATSTASITDVGSIESTFTFDWGSADENNYNTPTEETGTLTVTTNDTEIIFTSASDEKVYDGTVLVNHNVTVENLPSALTYQCTAGNTVSYPPDVGTNSNRFDDIPYSSVDEDGNEYFGWKYAIIRNADGEDVTDNFTNIKMVTGTLTINPLNLIVDLGSPTFDYDGNVHGCAMGSLSVKYGNGDYKDQSPTPVSAMSNDVGGGKATYTLHTGDSLIVTVGTAGPDAGTYTLSCTTTIESSNPDNYSVTVEGDTLTINQTETSELTGNPLAKLVYTNPFAEIALLSSSAASGDTTDDGFVSGSPVIKTNSVSASGSSVTNANNASAQGSASGQTSGASAAAKAASDKTASGSSQSGANKSSDMTTKTSSDKSQDQGSNSSAAKSSASDDETSKTDSSVADNAASNTDSSVADNTASNTDSSVADNTASNTDFSVANNTASNTDSSVASDSASNTDASASGDTASNTESSVASDSASNTDSSVVADSTSNTESSVAADSTSNADA